MGSVPVTWKGVIKEQEEKSGSQRADLSEDHAVGRELVGGEKGSNHKELVHHLEVSRHDK